MFPQSRRVRTSLPKESEREGKPLEGGLRAAQVQSHCPGLTQVTAHQRPPEGTQHRMGSVTGPRGLLSSPWAASQRALGLTQSGVQSASSAFIIPLRIQNCKKENPKRKNYAIIELVLLLLKVWFISTFQQSCLAEPSPPQTLLFKVCHLNNLVLCSLHLQTTQDAPPLL